MYVVTKRIDFCYGHRLLDYDGVCKHPHGHNAAVEIDIAPAQAQRLTAPQAGHREKKPQRVVTITGHGLKKRPQLVGVPHRHLDPGWPGRIGALGLDVGVAYGVHDLITGASYTWYGSRNFVILDPARAPAHVFAVT